MFPFEISIHVAVYVDVFEVPSEGLFDGAEVLAYICTFGTGSYVASVVRGEFEGTFVITTKNGRPLYNLVKLYQQLC